MSRLRPLWLLLITASAALVGVVVTLLMANAGLNSPVLPMSSIITMIAVGLVVLVLGLLVWRDQRRVASAEQDFLQQRRANGQGPFGQNPGPGQNTAQRQNPESSSSVSRPRHRIHPLQAARVAAAAQACAYAGALITGWHLGVLLHLGPVAGLGAPNAVSSLVMMIGGLFWVIIGFVVENMCALPPDRGEPRDNDAAHTAEMRRRLGGESDPGYAHQAAVRNLPTVTQPM